MGTTTPREDGTPRRPARRGGTPGTARRRRDAVAAYLLISPSVVLITVFGIVPLLFTAYVSLFNWRLAGGRFVGLANYRELLGPSIVPVAVFAGSLGCIALGAALRRRARVPLSRTAAVVVLAAGLASLAVTLPGVAAQGDREVFDALRVTIWYSLLTVPIQLAAGLLIALALTRKIRGRQVFRVSYLVPYVAPTVATAAIFQLLFSLRPDSPANEVLALLGIRPLQWLQEPTAIVAGGPSLALVSIVLYSWWVFVGYYALVYINGLMAIPRQVHEAAEVDGAGPGRRFFSITLPLLSPTTFFLTVLGVIGTFKAFAQLYVLRNPAAAATTDTISVEVFFTFFRKARLGYAAAISLLLFVIVLSLTVLQQRTLERGVTYGD